MRRLLIAVAVVASAVTPSFGATIRVDANGGGDYQTIQQGIYASSSGDTVLVARGVYVGESNRDIGLGGRSILVISEDGPWQTIIDAQHEARCFWIRDDEDSSSEISGFTLKNGGDTGRTTYGGGIFFWDSETTISDCVFAGCQAQFGGGIGIFQHNGSASPLIRNCVFWGNRAEDGGGIWSGTGSPTITGCTFFWNTATIFPGGAIGFAWDYATPTVTNCTIARNDGGGIYCYYTDPTIINTVIAFSDDTNGYGDAVTCTVANPEIANSITWQNAGGDFLCGNAHDNEIADPLFCDVNSNNFTVCENSPCLLGNNTWGVNVGARGLGCGNCTSAVTSTTWGSVKAKHK